MMEGAKGSMNMSSQNQSMAVRKGAPYMCGDLGRTVACACVFVRRIQGASSKRVPEWSPSCRRSIRYFACPAGRRLDRRSCVPLKEYIGHIWPTSGASSASDGPIFIIKNFVSTQPQQPYNGQSSHLNKHSKPYINTTVR
jgi:hypothetical protein